jgi:hypothetical protein
MEKRFVICGAWAGDCGRWLLWEMGPGASSLGRRLGRSWNRLEWKEVNGRDRANTEGVAAL